MATRNYDLERAEHAARQASADNKIKLQSELTGDRGALQHVDDVQLMNEMRGNKATVDFNRALFDYQIEMTRP